MGLRRAGALWLKEGKKGRFMSGAFEPEGRGGPKFKFLVFKNTKKEEPKDPDYTIHVSDDEEKPAHGEREESPF